MLFALVVDFTISVTIAQYRKLLTCFVEAYAACWSCRGCRRRAGYVSGNIFVIRLPLVLQLDCLHPLEQLMVLAENIF